MRDLTPEEINVISQRGPVSVHVFFLFTARNRSTGAAERLGLWTGDDHQAFNLDGTSRTYYGAGSILNISDLENAIGTDVRKHSLTVSNLTDEVQTLIRGYELRMAEVSVYSMFFSPESGLPISTARRRFKGWVDKAPIFTAQKNGTSNARIDFVSASRKLTRTVPSKRSDDNQKMRNSNDAFLSYVGMTGQVQVPWGTGDQVMNLPFRAQVNNINERLFRGR